jgi:two-component system NtrC family response regulator
MACDGEHRMNKLSILVVEDGKSQREMLRDFLKDEGHRVTEAANGEAAIKQVRNHYIDIILIDYQMPGMNGLMVVEAVKQLNPEIDLVIMTAYGTIETAVAAMKAGALDYIAKPIDLDELTILLDRVAEQRILKRENQALREDLKDRAVTTDQIIFKSDIMNEVVNLSCRVADSSATVLIQGETGTGKELISNLIHNLSRRSERPMIAVNCAALSESLLESELFGHEKGAFTGASTRRIGRFEAADGGTLFLDEIGEISLSVQVKLLRFVQEKEFQRVGGNQTIRSDVRVICATNQDLAEKVKEGKFREDLYYRLNVITIQVPPLRKRREDIFPLIERFLNRFAVDNNKDVQGIDLEARDILIKYDYPGNVRELENIIERAVVICRDSIISRKDLPFSEKALSSEDMAGLETGTMKESVEALEKQLITRAMEKASGHQTRAAELLGISERMLRYKLKKYGFK